MAHPFCFRTHTEPMFVFSPLGYSKLPCGESQPTNRFARMRALSSSQHPNFNRLPTELILEICEHLSTYDLWHNIRPTSRLLAACAQELLPRKFFQESSIHICWCCFWCSLGHHTLRTACSPITRLFPNSKRVEIAMISNRALLTKVIFGNLCNLITSREPKIWIRLGEEERDIRVGSDDIFSQGQKHTGNSVQDLRLSQQKFLAWYFAKKRQEVVKGRVVGSLEYAAHLLRFFTTSVILIAIGLALTVFACIALEVFKLVTNSYKVLRGLMRFCLGKEPLSH